MEDNKSLDDASLRRAECSAKMNSVHESPPEEYSNIVFTYLHDPWSEIRKDAAKVMKNMQYTRALVSLVIMKLLDLCDDAKTLQWQVVHGSILGIHALGASALDFGIVDMGRVRTTCLSLIGSETAPIRDVARSCLCDLHLVDRETLGLLTADIAHSCLEDIHSNKEIHASILDGLLGVLADSIELNLKLLSPCSSSSSSSFSLSPSTSPASKDTIFIFGHSIIDAIDLSMGHPSSTVRQRASQIFINVCRSSINEENGILFIVYEKIAAVVDGCNDWKKLEAYMIVSGKFSFCSSSSTSFLTLSSSSSSSSSSASCRCLPLPLLLLLFLPLLILLFFSCYYCYYDLTMMSLLLFDLLCLLTSSYYC